MRLGGRQNGIASSSLAFQSFARIFSLTAFLSLSHAQDAITSNPSIPSPSTTTPPNTSTSPTTLVTISSPSTDPEPPESFPIDPSPHTQPVHAASVFNYYFLFLFLFAVLIAILLLWFHRKRQQRQQQLRQNGQHALARDLEGWAGTRRFMHGRHGMQASARREEGLNEAGEAPPPYDGKAGETGVVDVPLQAVVRDERAQDPPGYDAADHGVGSYNVGRIPAGT